MKTCGTSLKK